MSGLSSLVGAKHTRAGSCAACALHLMLLRHVSSSTLTLQSQPNVQMCRCRYIVEFATSKADVAAFCAARARAGRPCVHQYSLALLGCSVEVQCLPLQDALSAMNNCTRVTPSQGRMHDSGV